MPLNEFAIRLGELKILTSMLPPQGRRSPTLLLDLVMFGAVAIAAGGFAAAVIPSLLFGSVGGGFVLFGQKFGVNEQDDKLSVPIFAFANAGVPVIGISLSTLATPILLGIIEGLFLGKQVGVFGATVAAIKLGIAEQPLGASIAQVYGVAVLTGVGFTMSLFIGSLAFEDETSMAQVRLGVLVASVVSALLGTLVLIFAARARLSHK